jgi:cobalt-zinc-cadmium efflux system outer membrane protein
VIFATILGAQKRIQIYDGQIKTLDGLEPLLRRRVEQGASSPADVNRAQVAADLVRAERERTQTTLHTARRELAALMGKTAPDFGAATGNFGAIGTPPSFASLLAAMDNHPQLARWTSIRAQRKAELVSARLKPAPDLRFTAGYRHFRETGDNAVTFGLSAELPLWDQNLGNVVAAQETLAKADAERATNKSTLLVLLSRAYEAASGAGRELKLLQSSTIPKAREALRAVEEGYAAGRFSLIDLLDTQASLSQALQREQEALVTFHTSVATVEWLTGAPMLFKRMKSQ